MLVSSRRAFLGGLFSSLVAAPAIVRIENIMPVRLFKPSPEWLYQWATEYIDGIPTGAVREMQEKYGWVLDGQRSTTIQAGQHAATVLMKRPKNYIYKPQYTQANLDALKLVSGFDHGVGIIKTTTTVDIYKTLGSAL